MYSRGYTAISPVTKLGHYFFMYYRIFSMRVPKGAVKAVSSYLLGVNIYNHINFKAIDLRVNKESASIFIDLGRLFKKRR